MSTMAQNSLTTVVTEITRFVWALVKMIGRLAMSPGRLIPNIDGMQLNKIMAAVLLAGVIGLTSGFLAELLVHPEESEELAYAPAGGGAAPTEAAEPAPEVDIATLLQTADPDAGQAFTRACTSCHTFDQGGPNRVGPNLWGVVERAKAGHEGFSYSSAMVEAGGAWTFEDLNHFLRRPRDFVPGTAMSYAGIRNDQDRANVIAYLRTLSDSPVALPEPPAPAEEEATDDAAAATDAGAAEEGAAVDEPAGDEQPAADEPATEEPATEEPATDAGDSPADGEADSEGAGASEEKAPE